MGIKILTTHVTNPVLLTHLTPDHWPIVSCGCMCMFIWSRRRKTSKESNMHYSGFWMTKKTNRERSRAPEYFLNGWVLPAVERFQTHENDTGKYPFHSSETDYSRCKSSEGACRGKNSIHLAIWIYQRKQVECEMLGDDDQTHTLKTLYTQYVRLDKTIHSRCIDLATIDVTRRPNMHDRHNEK